MPAAASVEGSDGSQTRSVSQMPRGRAPKCRSRKSLIISSWPSRSASGIVVRMGS